MVLCDGGVVVEVEVVLCWCVMCGMVLWCECDGVMVCGLCDRGVVDVVVQVCVGRCMCVGRSEL